MTDLQTVKVYDTQPTATEIKSKVLKCLPDGEGIAIILDRTCFFPGGGGQDADRGTLDGQEVISLKEVGAAIYHVVKQEIPEGKEIILRIDHEKRLNDLEIHSGEHILSGTAFRLFGAKNVGFHIGKDFNTADFDKPLDENQLIELELEVNRLIRTNTPITVGYPDQEEINRMALRKKPETDEPLRVVHIEGADLCACCGTHGTRSGDVGLLRIISSESLRGGTRVSFLCGGKASQHTIEEHYAALHASNLYSSKIIELPVRILKERKKTAEVKSEKIKVEELLTEEIIKGLSEKDELIEETLPLELPMLKKIAEKLTARPGRAVFLYGKDGYVLMKHPESKVDLQEKNRVLLSNGAKGGGNNLFYSGKLIR